MSFSSNIEINDGKLIISPIEDKDLGDYECHASSEYGSTELSLRLDRPSYFSGYLLIVNHYTSIPRISKSDSRIVQKQHALVAYNQKYSKFIKIMSPLNTS